MKYTVLTYLFGTYDTLKDPDEVDPEATYVCVTDRKDLTSNVWNIIYEPALDTNEFTGIQKSFYVKYHGFISYIAADSEYLVRLDASIKIYKSLQPIIQYIHEYGYDCMLEYHSLRQDDIDEYNKWIVDRAGYDPTYKDIYVRKMSKLGYDITMPGMLETTIQIYHLNPQVLNFIKDVDTIINETSNYKDNNDQCYYKYALYKNFDKLNVLYVTTQILASNYMDSCFHGSDIPMFTDHYCSEGFNLSKRNIKPLFDTFVDIHYFT